MEKIFQRHLVVADIPDHVAESLDLLGGLVAATGNEPFDVADRTGQVGQGAVKFRAAVVEHAAHRGEAILERHDLIVTVPQCGDEGLQVLDNVDDVAAAVGEDPTQARQLLDGLPQLVPVAVHRGGGAVDEASHRRRRHSTARAEICRQPGQLGFDLVPLHWHSGAVEIDHGSVAHRRSAGFAVHPISRCQLDEPGTDKILGDDHRVGISGDGHAALDAEGHLRPGALRLDRLDGTHPDPGNPNLVSGVDRLGTGEIGGNRCRLQSGVTDQHCQARGDEHRQRGGDEGGEPFARHPGTCPVRRHVSQLLFHGKGNSARGPALSGGWPALTPRRNPKM